MIAEKDFSKIITARKNAEPVIFFAINAPVIITAFNAVIKQDI